jgi:hypothetical protein
MSCGEMTAFAAVKEGSNRSPSSDDTFRSPITATSADVKGVSAHLRILIQGHAASAHPNEDAVGL